MNKIIYIVILLNISATRSRALAAPCDLFSQYHGRPTGPLDDPFQRLVTKLNRCPKDVKDLRQMLIKSGVKLTTTMVANRGFHNPGAGSFSFFETAEILNESALGVTFSADQLMFGHFTTSLEEKWLDLDQTPAKGALMIEMIAWDLGKEVFNFYELIGHGREGQWHYRGDSKDIWADTKNLNMPMGNTKPFGENLRCSGCHIAGGPIMKELEAPNDSWWKEARPLALGDRKPTDQMQSVLSNVTDALELTKSVKAGVSRLFSGKGYKDLIDSSPKFALRPLFCAQEVNLASSFDTLDGVQTASGIPVDFFVDHRLSSEQTVPYSRESYLKTLESLGSHFPGTALIDADHSWLVPVKAWSEKMATDMLISAGMISDEFVSNVLAIDVTRPLFSRQRCALLKHIPESWSPSWLDEFKERLGGSNSKAAAELLANLNDTSRNQTFHRDRARSIIENCKKNLKSQGAYASLLEYIGQVRNEIKFGDISKNPRGQILEPGFRVIFPEWSFAYEPFSKSLDDNCSPGL